MTPEKLARQYEDRAAAEQAAGGSISINHLLPTIAIRTSNEKEWFFQGEDAENLLDEVPDWLDVDPETYLLAASQNW